MLLSDFEGATSEIIVFHKMANTCKVIYHQSHASFYENQGAKTKNSFFKLLKNRTDAFFMFKQTFKYSVRTTQNVSKLCEVR